ncbi:DUF499 domain-containing protein [Thermochromatium tepidum]|uniref:DUF499 domain-containing protein n=1 Tax=Thermochromatium tepidum ATCC 43061 TaxID=316276 RepID=A0A6I6EEX4_THETI|nr:DUF499 domain-containing protein [Thermochromatium tepidum]QGU33786.1 DUF499 domain-containing protein [Thermochromatium tepidum ATCC 43061]
MAKTTTKPWHQVVQLRDDITNQELSQKQFAADLYDVVMGRNPGVYHDAKEFFALTYPTVKLRDLARDVTWRLSGKSEKAVRQLHMTFGGGKTHSLITLVHLVRDPASLPDIPAVQQFKAHCALEGGLPKARVAAVVFDRLDAEKGMEVTAPDGSVATVKMPWSAIAWQLAGTAGMKLLKDDGTERATPPATGVMEDLLKLARKDGAGVLILFDEVLWFVRVMADTDPAWIGRVREFMHSLTQAVAKVPQCCLVASLLASDPGKMDELGKQISKELYDEFKRVADEGIQPVESQDVPEILRRRLLKLESYTDRTQWPSQVFGALNGVQSIDEYTAKNRAAEEKRYTDAYPFHPALIETLYQKWTQLEGFQQTRGIIKTLASALRDAVKWDQQPLIGAQIFLVEPKSEGLSVAARELANVAQLEQYEGRRQNWTAILEAELAHARKAQDGLLGVQHREIEQAVMATFLHSQPIGQRVTTRELKVLIGVGSPDRIELDKGLSRWSDASWYLDDTFTGDREGGLPKVWRLGSKPNLKQMHHDARQNVSSTAVEEVLEAEIAKAKQLAEGARTLGAKVHVLPARPADIEDDEDFHYAVLGPKAACNGKPGAEARRFIDETTGPDRPRAKNRNAVVLAVPSKDGIDVAREKVRDLLGWEKVREMLKERSDIDTATTARLEANIRAARGEMGSQVIMAYCIAVTVNDSNEVAAYRINVDNDPLFPKMVADKRLRIESTAVNAEALLPGGPFDLWADGDKARFVKDLVGAFAATAKLPKMLNRAAILETLLQGCEAGEFVLRVTRADKPTRTFWMSRPDDNAVNDLSLEVVLSDAAVLSELDPQLLAPGRLPCLWDKEPLTLADLSAYFSGKHFVEVDKGGYTENLLIPEATAQAITDAVAAAVKSGRVWLVNGTVSVLAEDVPAGFVNDSAQLFAPPLPLASVDVLPAQLPSAWQNDATNAHLIHAALSSKGDKVLPWTRVAAALDEAFRLGLIERTLDSGPWPCDLGGAAAVKIVARKSEDKDPPPPKHYGSKAASADLQTHEVQDLADHIDALREATAGHPLRIRVTVEIGEAGKVEQEVIERVNGILGKIKAGWKVG